ncbi:FecR family protein [Pedobacter westerhofensis]|uniref:FecR family protein n=1 Tax=Pedobacter westerhofensis TaxID=425512 RepID=A0A521FQB3_9SPHI|nr:FecR domain-containing protein [Pedobacter westerhofensis]SMO98274.1 FecR family protein [Pedobacter westerhofensis]
MDDHIKSLFKRYQEGTATAAERQLVETWFESHYGQKGRMLSRNEETSVFEDLDARISAMLADEPVITRKLNFRWMQVAAMFIALLGSGLFIRNKFSKKTIQPETFTEIRSLKGEKKEVTLKDGTTVFLNSGSSVFISSRFDAQKREVKLSGEAFFQVHHNASKPFIIHSGKLQTTVLGTSFDIKAYPEDEHVKVSVATGRVKVEKPDAAKLYAKALTHNQALVYDKVKDSHRLTTVNIDSISAWRTNHLNFDNASYEEIARMLSRWYNLDVTLNANHRDTKRYTLSFFNERPDKVLNVLSALTGMTYTMNGRKVIINPKNQF